MLNNYLCVSEDGGEAKMKVSMMFTFKTRFWRQNDEKLDNFVVETNILLVIGTFVLWVERNLTTKVDLYRRSIKEAEK